MLRPCLTRFPVLIGLYHPHMIGDNNTRNQTFWCSFLHFLFHSVLDSDRLHHAIYVLYMYNAYLTPSEVHDKDISDRY